MPFRVPRGEKWTPEQKNARKQKWFLRVLLENGGFPERAIRTCSTSRYWLNRQLAEDEEFALLYSTIRDQNNEKIEEEIYRRAVTGVDKPLSNKGELTGHKIREWSDTLLIFLAKAKMPDKYRDLPQKERELTDDEIDSRLAAYMAKRDSKGQHPLSADGPKVEPEIDEFGDIM